MTADSRTVWLTGGSTGIGSALCESLLEQGAQVVNFARRPAPFDSPQLTNLCVDLTDAEATREVVAEIAASQPATEVVHNAGATFEKPLEEVTAEDFDCAAQLHLAAAITLVQAALPTMRERRYGRILLMSTRAVVGLEKRTVYSATKAGLIGMARTWALELAAHGITANVVAPGPVEDTEMFHAAVPKGSELSARVASRVPVGRLGRPADICRAVNFFLSPDAGFVTGQTLFVCGGASVGNMSFT